MGWGMYIFQISTLEKFINGRRMELFMYSSTI